jgi:ABC-type uncharacterized transport system substrate-binding protein
MVTRRAFLGSLTLGLLAAPLAAEAQPVGKVYRIGVLESTSPALNAANLAALQQELRELGYVERQNYAIEYRSADGRVERFPDLAAELVRLKVDLIVTRGRQGRWRRRTPRELSQSSWRRVAILLPPDSSPALPARAGMLLG